MSNIVKVPSTLEEAFEELDKNLLDTDKQFLLSDSETKIIAQIHHGLGRWLRNNWLLWSGEEGISIWFKSIGIDHADDMSSIILISYIRRSRNEPINLEEQVSLYKDFWLKSNPQ